MTRIAHWSRQFWGSKSNRCGGLLHCAICAAQYGTRIQAVVRYANEYKEMGWSARERARETGLTFKNCCADLIL
jgi:hypothetical protein